MSDAARNLSIIACIALLIALPFLFRRDAPHDTWQPGNPVLVIISPHNEAIRQEFAAAFSRWHEQHHGSPVRIDWRNIGGTTEIMRYLESEYLAAFRPWSAQQGLTWPERAAQTILDSRFDPHAPPTDPRDPHLWQAQRELWLAYRNHDDPNRFGSRIDLFFGGGTYDHDIAHRRGFSVPPWPHNQTPESLFSTPDGTTLIPQALGGEIWRSHTFFGSALSTFGICSNLDRLQDLGIESPPRTWRDLTDPRLFRQIGVADPTKSGSIAKAFEMIIQQECMLAVREAGFSPDQIDAFERTIHEAGLPRGVLPDEIPAAYQAAIEQGWHNGINLIRMIGANARYFTDAAGKVPIDVGNGDAAAGIAIDFYGRYQAEFARTPNAPPRMIYHTPVGGSSVSADPISLLRGAPNRDLAVLFIEFVLATEGQRLWTYRPGTPGGPRRFALRRLPIRRDFYPAPDHPGLHAAHLAHLANSTDDLADPTVNPYTLAQGFTYHPRWTAAHFGVHRNLIRAMAMDAGSELRAAWQAIHQTTDPQRRERALAQLHQLPDRPAPLNWLSALELYREIPTIDLMREWTLFFRRSYRQAAAIAKGEAP